MSGGGELTRVERRKFEEIVRTFFEFDTIERRVVAGTDGGAAASARPWPASSRPRRLGPRWLRRRH